MNGLMLDSPKAGPATREVACNQSLIPAPTRTYQPLPNKILLDLIYNIAKESDVALSNEQLGLDRLGKRMFGVCNIDGKDFLGEQIQMMIGFCNSYDGTMATRFCIGGEVFVCSNRAMHAYTDEKTGLQLFCQRMHWQYDQDNHEGLIVQIRESFQKIDDFRDSQEKYYEQLINRRVSDDKAYATIVRAAQQKIIKKTSVLTVANEWNRQAQEPVEEPHYEWHPEFRDRNAYSLFNAFTQVEKERLARNPVASNISTIGLSNFFTQELCLN